MKLKVSKEGKQVRWSDNGKKRAGGRGQKRKEGNTKKEMRNLNLEFLFVKQLLESDNRQFD